MDEVCSTRPLTDRLCFVVPREENAGEVILQVLGSPFLLCTWDSPELWSIMYFLPVFFSTSFMGIILHLTPSYIWNFFFCVMSRLVFDCPCICWAFSSVLNWFASILIASPQWCNCRNFITRLHVWGYVFPLFHYCFRICLAIYTSLVFFGDKF